jgi:D-alanyl-D-alanine carboxypeptidase (penicillin-binding protein 5/6)
VRSSADPAVAGRHRLVALAILVALGSLTAIPGLGRAQGVEPPPPTPVPVPGGGTSPSPFPSVLRTPPPPAVEPPEVAAAAAVLLDLDTGQTLYALNARERRPVASLTKIMTALLVLSRTSPTDVVTVGENAASGPVVGISTLGLVAGERITVQQLLYALLLQSANDAAVALAEHVSGSVDAFVDLMNRTARRLGLSRTVFASPNGLDDTGFSTARDMARLTRAAYRRTGFDDVVATRVHEIPSPSREPRVVQNRNALLWLYPGAIGVKTGFTTAAGYCIVATAERGDERLLAVVLGEPREAFSDAAALLDHGFDAFERTTLIGADVPVGPVEIGGRQVGVVTGTSVVGLVPIDAVIRRRVVVDPGVRYPPGLGQRVGSVVVTTSDGRVVGEVPLVVAGVPPPPPLADEGSWWSRAVGALVDAGAGLVDALLS